MIHVHVYKVEALAEVNIETEDPVEARFAAFKQTTELNFGKADCRYVAVTFENEEKE